jgi:putative endonuclease
MKKYWIYIMSNLNKTIYVGMTDDLERRVSEHKNKLVKGLTSKYDCALLVYYESLDDPTNTINREKQVKGLTRAKKIALIESVNPRWEDLAASWGRPMLMMNESVSEREEKLRTRRKLAAAK